MLAEGPTELVEVVLLVEAQPFSEYEYPTANLLLRQLHAPNEALETGRDLVGLHLQIENRDRHALDHVEVSEGDCSGN